MTSPPAVSTFAAFRWPEFRRLLLANASVTVASRALAVVLGYQVYELTENPLYLGVLGLVEAIPALSLALYGGHVADRRDRRGILCVTMAALTICSVGFALLSALESHAVILPMIYSVVFVAGIARGFAEPAAAALEAQVVPKALLVNCSTWMATSWLSCAVLGPVLAGYVYAWFGATVTYAVIAVFFGLGWLNVLGVHPKPPPEPPSDESIWGSISVGVRYVLGSQVLLGSMALDLFAVFFGGAIALLPVFAKDILHVGPAGLGMLMAAQSIGQLLSVLWATRFPPVRHAGRNLLASVLAFGVAMIVFGLSENFYLSLLMLLLSGIFDGVSVVIRRSIMRLLSPDHLRGRIAAVSMIFIGSSNELGALESGIAASLLGTVRSVWLGGVVTLAVVALTAWRAPNLRRLSLDPRRAAKDSPEQDTADALSPYNATAERLASEEEQR